MGEDLPPVAEENGAHAQEREANCGLQHVKIRKRSTNVDCGRRTYCRVWNTGRRKKLDFHYSEKKSSFGNLYSNVDFLIITTNSGGLAAMHTMQKSMT